MRHRLAALGAPLASLPVAAWIASQRDLLRPKASPLGHAERAVLVRHFAASTLERVRVVVAAEGDRRGPVPVVNGAVLDHAGMAGVTYGDVVFLNRPARGGARDVDVGLLFHEMVHVVQYSLLGVTGFARAYVKGWIGNGFDYRAIPLEVQAYELQVAFDGNLLAPAPLEERIRATLPA